MYRQEVRERCSDVKKVAERRSDEFRLNLSSAVRQTNEQRQKQLR